LGSLRDGCFRLVLYDWGVVGKDPVGIFKGGLFASVLLAASPEFWLPLSRAVVRVVITITAIRWGL
jgi:hypothetical protein